MKSDKKQNEAMKRAAGHVLDILPKILDITAEVSGNFGVPGLSTGISALSNVLQKVQTMSANVEGVEALEERVAKLAEVLEQFRGRAVPEPMQQRINGLFNEWAKLGEQSKKIKSHNRIIRFLKSSMDAEELSSLVQKFNTSLQEFQFESALHTEVTVHETQTDVRHVREQIDQMRIQHDESFISTYAKNAPYNASNIRRACLEGTRVKIRQQVHVWIDKNVSRLLDGLMKNGSIFWLNGLAGAGKTTIAFSIAEECSRQGILGGSFFCSRFDAECSDPNLIFVTISRQLCRVYPAYKEKIVAALRQDPDLVNAGVSRQLEELIVRPLEALKGTLPPFVVVIDALDECRDQTTTSTVLDALAKFIGRLAPLLFVITSRPEPRITALFGKSCEVSLADVTTPLLLHEVQLQSVLEDIKRFLRHGFDRIRSLFEIDEEWPSAQDLDQLARLSNGLFIFASTALGFVEDPKFLDPEGQLQSLLTRQSLSQSAVSIMDALYSHILEASYPAISAPLADKLQTILGAITLAREPLSTTGFARLLNVSESSIRTTLSGLRSVLYIPEDKAQLIRVIHPTFPEFLLRESSLKKDAFCIGLIERHHALLSRCLDILRSLQRNPLLIENPTLLKHEIPDLTERVAKHLPSHLSYACRHWVAHLEGSLGSGNRDDTLNSIQDFIHNRLLHWLEACSWLDAFGSALSSLSTAQLCCKVLNASDLASTFVDIRRLALAYSACINDAPLQVYYSALFFAPSSSRVAQMYSEEIQHPIAILQGGLVDWGPYLATISGGEGQIVYSVVFSPDGRPRFLTGGRDNTIGIWHSTTCTKILSIEGHTDSVISVGYSPDAKHIVSGSKDQTVRIWDAESGAHIRTLKGHADAVYFVTYSADGTRVLSAAREGEAKLWDTSDGRCLRTFNTGAWPTWQVSISSDGSLIAHGSISSVCLLNLSTGEGVELELPDEGRAALFSPDGQYVAGATDAAIHIWRVSDKTGLRIIDVPQSLNRMAFSADSKQIGCGCDDGSVRLWEVDTDDPPRVLTGHSKYVNDIAFSLDGSQLISAGFDGTVRVWDMSYRSTANSADPSPHHSSRIGVPQFAVIENTKAVTLCQLSAAAAEGKTCRDITTLPKGAPLVKLCSTSVEAWNAALQSDALNSSLSVDDLVNRCRVAHAWEFWVGRPMFQRSSSSMPSALSQDGSLMAYMPQTSNDDVHICNLTTGTVVLTFSHGHTDDIVTAAFSPGNGRLATGSKDHNLKIWDLTSGNLVSSHSEHTGHVCSIAFSSDSRLVVSGGSEAQTYICDVETGRILQSFGHHNWTPIFTFIDDDKAIMTLDVWNQHFLVYLWDVATGACIHQHSLRGDMAWIRSVNFSADDTGISFGAGEGGGRNIQLWRPGERRWPVYNVACDGWVYAKRPGRTQRLCWLPPEWRNPLSSDGNVFCFLDRSAWKVVELDMSQILAFADTWS